MASDEVRVPWEALKAFSSAVFRRVGLPPEDAELEAEVLVWANLRGIDSHGVLRIPWYVELVDQGVMNPRPNIRIEKETPATLLIDADGAFGPVVTTFAMKRVMQKAKAEPGKCAPGASGWRTEPLAPRGRGARGEGAVLGTQYSVPLTPVIGGRPSPSLYCRNGLANDEPRGSSRLP